MAEKEMEKQGHESEMNVLSPGVNSYPDMLKGESPCTYIMQSCMD